jgi:glycosyltransferase involved in cell wall biosynthesis
MIKKIKVLECIRQGQIGGGESHLLSLVENLDRARFEPVVLSFTDGPMVNALKSMGVECRVIHTERPFDIFKWKLVKQFIKEQEVDIVHAHGTRANSNIIWAARSLKIPVIYTVHGWSFHQDQNPLVRRIRIMGEKYLVSKSSLTISVSLSNQQSGKKYIKFPNSIVINNGIDRIKFDPEKPYPDIRKEFQIPETAILVLFIARFTAHKQPLSLIQAFAKTIPVNDRMHLLMVGDGDQKQAAVELISKLGLQDKITLAPFRQDVPSVLATADIFVLPSLWEGLPIGLLEAMSMGKAVIATNVDGTSEIIRNCENGLLINTNGLVNNLANSLVNMAEDENLRKAFSEKAKATIKERFDVSNMTIKIENKYLDVLKENKYGI